MTENLQEIVSPAGRERTGLYVHVPFCARSCDFCAFYQIQPRRDDVVRYLDGVAREARLPAVGTSRCTTRHRLGSAPLFQSSKRT